MDEELPLWQNRVSIFYDNFSDSKKISSGVPQGSFLGPLLCKTFINSLPYFVKNADVVMHADDSVLYVTNFSGAGRESTC